MENAKRSRQKMLMTEGPLLGKMIVFMLPLLITNLLQTFYNSADMMIVSLSSEPNAVGAIGTTGSFLTLVLAVFIGFSVGSTVAVAKRIGAGDEEGAARAAHTGLVLGFLMGFVAMGVGMVSARPLLRLMGAKENLLDLAVTYTLLRFLGTPFTALTNFTIAIYRAKGDTRTPLWVLTGTGLLNVVLNLFFVKAAGLSVEGVAIATAISSATSAIVLLAILSRAQDGCRFSFRQLRIEKRAMREIISVGVPAGLQGAVFAISNMIIQSSILKVDSAAVPATETFRPVVKGNAAATNLANFVITALAAVRETAVSFTGQNVGAKKFQRVWRVTGCCLLIGTALGLLTGYGIYFLRQPLLGFYGVHPDEAGTVAAIAYDTAVKRILYVMTTYFIMAWQEACCGVLRGLGKSLTSTIITVFGICVLRVCWISIVDAIGKLSLFAIYISYPVSWAVTSAFLVLFCVLEVRKRLNAQKAAELA